MVTRLAARDSACRTTGQPAAVGLPTALAAISLSTSGSSAGCGSAAPFSLAGAAAVAQQVAVRQWVMPDLVAAAARTCAALAVYWTGCSPAGCAGAKSVLPDLVAAASAASARVGWPAIGQTAAVAQWLCWQ
jgi:hypothetical protein